MSWMDIKTSKDSPGVSEKNEGSLPTRCNVHVSRQHLKLFHSHIQDSQID